MNADDMFSVATVVSFNSRCVTWSYGVVTKWQLFLQMLQLVSTAQIR